MTILERLFWMAIGFGLGVVVCNFEFAINTAAQTLHRRRDGDKVYRYDPLRWLHIDPVKRQRIKDIGVWLCVLLAFVAAYLTGVNAKHAEDSAGHSEDVSDCVIKIAGQLLDAQNAARDVTTPLRRAETEFDKSQLDTWLYFLDPDTALNTTEEERVAYFRKNFIIPLQKKVEASAQVDETLADFPLPTKAQLLSCVD